MQTPLIALSTALLLTGPQPGYPKGASPESDSVVTIENCQIVLKADIDVPAREAGQLIALSTPRLDANGNPVLDSQGQPVYQEVLEGLRVFKGQELGRIDDSLQRAQKRITESRLQAAEAEAKNRVRVDYAEATYKVAETDLEGLQLAKNSYRVSVSPAEERRTKLSRDQAELGVKQAELDFTVAGLNALGSQAEDEAAQVQIERRKIVSPVDGIVERVYKHAGDWVIPGEAVLRVIRMDQVRIEGRADATRYLPFHLEGQPVTAVTVRFRGGEENVPGSSGGAPHPIQGRLFHASQIVDASELFRVVAEVENVWVTPDPSRPERGYWLLRQGLVCDITIAITSAGRSPETADADRPNADSRSPGG